MHAKVLVVDGVRAYLGSVNYSTNSATKARELGLVLTDPPALSTLTETFESDWAGPYARGVAS